MKKFISIILTMCIMLSVLSFTVLSADNISNVFVYDNKEITVQGDNLSYSEMKRIADYIAGESELDNISPLGITCTLFGHQLSTTYATQIEHNVYSTSPRCVEKEYKVEACSRCEYIEKTLISSARITCH